MRQRLHAWWMRARGYRRFHMTTGRGGHGWYRKTAHDFRFPHKTGEGIYDDGRSVDFYGVVPPQEGQC